MGRLFSPAFSAQEIQDQRDLNCHPRKRAVDLVVHFSEQGSQAVGGFIDGHFIDCSAASMRASISVRSSLMREGFGAFREFSLCLQFLIKAA